MVPEPVDLRNGERFGIGQQPTGASLVGVQSARCLDATGQGTTAGTTVQIWDCNGQPNQKWTRR